MWFWFYCAILAALALFAVSFRSLILAAVERVQTREPRTLAELQFIVHLLHGDPEKVKLITTKDRSAPTGRRGAVKMLKAKASEEQRKKEALATIRKRLGKKLAQRKQKRATMTTTLWNYFGWAQEEKRQ
jgi:hypothetical protein